MFRCTLFSRLGQFFGLTILFLCSFTVSKSDDGGSFELESYKQCVISNGVVNSPDTQENTIDCFKPSFELLERTEKSDIAAFSILDSLKRKYDCSKPINDESLEGLFIPAGELCGIGEVESVDLLKNSEGLIIIVYAQEWLIFHFDRYSCEVELGSSNLYTLSASLRWYPYMRGESQTYSEYRMPLCN